jgi:hypothetical protein
MTGFLVSQFKSELEREAARFGLAPDTIRIVRSVKEYCASLGKSELEDSDSRAAICVWDARLKPLIVMRDQTTPLQQSNALVPLLVRGFPGEQIRRLNDPLTFARHLLLHEIAHFLRRQIHAKLNFDAIERDCDSWAFAQL